MVEADSGSAGVGGESEAAVGAGEWAGGNSPEMAIRLDKAFGGGASTWYQLQAAYDMAQAIRRADEIRVDVPAEVVALRELAGRHSVDEE